MELVSKFVFLIKSYLAIRFSDHCGIHIRDVEEYKNGKEYGRDTWY